MSGDHHSTIKWVEELKLPINWENVWKTVHSFLVSNHTRTEIWKQIHLNFYTQYYYNKWHKHREPYPLCREIPESIYHIILHCNFTNTLWYQIQPKLREIFPLTVTNEEKAFGIVQKKQNNVVLLRNWITYKMREEIAKEERTAYNMSTIPNFMLFKQRFNSTMRREIRGNFLRYKNENKIDFFSKIMTYGKALCGEMVNEEFIIKDIFAVHN